jgi:phosphonoacetaldehyde hydrolase
MSAPIPNMPYSGPVQAVVLDWAGTAVDYGCMGPAAVFVDVFKAFDIAVSVAEARQFMGLEKQQHVRRMCQLPEVATQWEQRYGRIADENDVAKIYELTEPMMVDTITRHAEPIPGLLEFAEGMRKRHIKIGSCTGYTAPMMSALVPAAAKNGYSRKAWSVHRMFPPVDPCPGCATKTPFYLQVYPLGHDQDWDTISDIQEGRNAGMWTVGLTQSGNELGLPEDRVNRAL